MEYVDIVNEKDEVIDKVERNEAHARHLLHRAIQVMIENDKRQILLQLRKATKKQYPSFWSSSVAAHVSSGETAEECAKRELKEELGIDIPVEYVSKYIFKGPTEYEMVSVFFARSNGPFRLEKSEMDEAEFFDIENIKQGKMKITPLVGRGLDLVLKKHS